MERIYCWYKKQGNAVCEVIYGARIARKRSGITVIKADKVLELETTSGERIIADRKDVEFI